MKNKATTNKINLFLSQLKLMKLIYMLLY